MIENRKLVSVMRELLSTKEENVEKALLYRTVATGRDVIEKQHTEQEASYGRDALAKVRGVKEATFDLCVGGAEASFTGVLLFLRPCTSASSAGSWDASTTSSR